jgi:hypothetical protein
MGIEISILHMFWGVQARGCVQLGGESRYIVEVDLET